MKEEINKCLLSAWSSSIGGIDTGKAVNELNKYIEEVKADTIHTVSKAYAEELSDLNDDLDSFELDLENSNNLLQQVLPELLAYRSIHSNNPNKYSELSQLIYRIEEQIIKNEK